MIQLTAKDLMRTKFVQMQKTAFATELIGRLKVTGDDIAVIYDNQKYIGIVTKGHLFKKRHDLSKLSILSLIESIQVLSPTTPFLGIVDALLGSDRRALPVVDDNKVLGIVNAADVVMQIRNVPELKKIKAAEVGSLKPVTIAKGTKLGNVFSIMEKAGIGRLPIVDSNNKLVGIVSYRDIMEKYLVHPITREGGFRGLSRTPHAIGTKAFSPLKLDILSLPVENEMSTNIVAISKNDSLSRILQMMQRFNIADVVLATDNELEGIVTLRDLLKVFLVYKTERRNIQFTGLPDLDEIDKAAIEKLVSNAYDKTERLLDNEIFLKVHIKQHEVDGMRRKYSVHCKLDSAGLHMDASSAKEGQWKLLTAVQDAISVIEKDIAKRVRRPRWKQI